jgi:epoxyqueuosine reductase QueG
MKSLDDLFGKVDADKTGVLRVDDWKESPIGEYSRKYLPGAESVIILTMEIFPEVVGLCTSRRQMGEAAMRDLFKRNLDIINGHLDYEAYKIIKKLHIHGYKGLSFTAGDSPTDGRFLESLFSYKYAAVAAGLGVIGWHSMLLSPEFGARQRLGVVLTDAPLEPTRPRELDLPCDKCGGACVKICPAGAIHPPMEGSDCNVDKYACAAYLNASGGCGECMKVCPAGPGNSGF